MFKYNDSNSSSCYLEVCMSMSTIPPLMWWHWEAQLKWQDHTYPADPSEGGNRNDT